MARDVGNEGAGPFFRDGGAGWRAAAEAQAVSGIQKIHAVMGGFHIAAAPEPSVARVVDALKQLDPEYLIPMHCSGELFSRLAQQAMPGRVITNYTGTRYIFGA
jgi:7,8-dihydropterin-6-yl-methyl-4-(beta-D-ribofuranosyl)aminobenzene 5'-phosphate synthase